MMELVLGGNISRAACDTKASGTALMQKKHGKLKINYFCYLLVKKINNVITNK